MDLRSAPTLSESGGVPGALCVHWRSCTVPSAPCNRPRSAAQPTCDPAQDAVTRLAEDTTFLLCGTVNPVALSSGCCRPCSCGRSVCGWVDVHVGTGEYGWPRCSWAPPAEAAEPQTRRSSRPHPAMRKHGQARLVLPILHFVPLRSSEKTPHF